jgi:hypothetical protein
LVTPNEIGSYSESARDVTEQFVDTAARAASINATHARLLALMSRADTVNDVLNVQRELQVRVI